MKGMWVAARRELEPSGWHVYVVWSTPRPEGRPLYVGLTGRIYVRIGEHLHGSPWRDEIRWFQCFPTATATDADELEHRLIGELDPIYNRRRSRAVVGPTFDRNRALMESAR